MCISDIPLYRHSHPPGAHMDCGGSLGACWNSTLVLVLTIQDLLSFLLDHHDYLGHPSFSPLIPS